MKALRLIFSARKLIALTWLVTICTAAAQPLPGVVSPKLRQFLAGNPSAEQIISEVMSVSFSNRPVQIYYFYSDDDSRPRGGLYYAGETRESPITLTIRENQETCDEYLTLLLWTLYSQGEKRTIELMEQAKTGALSRADFEREVKQQEFQVLLKARGLLKRLKLTTSERESSFYYKWIAECPDDFVEFLLYKPKGAVSCNPSSQPKDFYDSLRKGQ